MISAVLILTTIAITDGDTLRSGDLRIRLWGIDAPELKDHAGPAAKQALADLTCEMVKAGHAVDWPKYSGGAYAGCEE